MFRLFSQSLAEEPAVFDPETDTVFIAPRYFPGLLTGPFSRRSLPITAANIKAERPIQNKEFVVQNLFRHQQLDKHPLYSNPNIYEEKIDKIWTPVS